MTLSSELRPLLQKVMVDYTVYMKGVKQGETLGYSYTFLSPLYFRGDCESHDLIIRTGHSFRK